MSYYSGGMRMGDYSTGGYGYRAGDPGLFSFLAPLIPKVIKFFKKPVVKAVIGAAAGGAAIEAGQQLMAPPGAPPVAMPGGAIPGAAAFQPGAFAGVRCPRPVIPLLAGGTCPVGYHPRKSDGAVCVRNRRMNVANPRALRKSMRRVQGFERLARKTIRFTKRVKMKKRTCA